MYYSRTLQWQHIKASLIWPDGPVKNFVNWVLIRHSPIKSESDAIIFHESVSPGPLSIPYGHKSGALRVVYKILYVCSINVKINKKSGSVPPNQKKEFEKGCVYLHAKKCRVVCQNF